MSAPQNKNKIIGIVAVLILVGVIAYYMIHQSNVNKLLRKTNLIISITEMPDTLNPILAASDASLTLIDPIFDGLTSRSGERVDDYQDILAAEFEQGETNKEYIITLDTSRAWHDNPNHMLSADDVIFTYQAIINPDNRSPLRGRINKQIRKITKEDAETITVLFKEAVAPAIVGKLLSFKIIPATYNGEKMGSDLRNDPVAKKFARSPIGTGPFKFDHWEGNDIVFNSTTMAGMDLGKASADSVDGGLKIRTMTFTLVHDQQKQARMLMDKKIDLVLDSDPDLHQKLNEAGLQHSDYVPHYFYALSINSTKKPFNSASVRRGLSQAIDKVAAVRTVWKDSPENFVNKGVFPHNAEPQYQSSSFRDLNQYNVSSAKRLLRSLRGKEITLIYPEAGGKNVAKFAGKIIQDLQAAGMTVNAKALGLAFDTQLQNKTYDIALVRYEGFTKGYNVTPLLASLSAQNYTGWGNKKFDRLLARWQDTGFWIKRLPLAIDIHRELGKQSPYTFLFTLPTRAYYAPRFKDVMLTDPSAILGSVESWSIKE